MISYYQDQENGKAKWIEFQDSELEQVKQTAYHIGLYFLNRSPDEESKDPIIYKGDLVLEIDHKPEEGETINDAIHRSIVDMQNLKAYFQEIGVNPDDCEWFLSGGKGGHCVIPKRILGATVGYEALPHLHKYVASVIAYRAEIKGLDFGIYSLGKGHLLRVANKQRSNGNYKVQISPFELEGLTPDRYFEIVKEPDTLFEPTKNPPVCLELSGLFQEAITNFKRPKKQEVMVLSEQFAELDGMPKCIAQILKRENIKPSTGEFNSAKMSLARYLAAAVPEEEREPLIQEFAENWDSSKHPTVKERQNEVYAALRCFEGKGFLCSPVRSGLETSPCSGCPIAKQPKESGKGGGGGGTTFFTGITLEEGVYKKTNKEGDSYPISNFIISTLTAFYEAEKPDHIESLLVSIKVVDSSRAVQARLFPKDLKTKSGLKNATCSVPGTSFNGTDDDADKIYALLTNEKLLSEVKQMTAVKTLGILHHASKSREIDEMVWVQDGWSVNTTGVEDTVHYASPVKRQGATNEHESLVLDLRDSPEEISAEAMEVFMALLKSRNRATTAAYLGFVAACWLKPILQRREYDNIFPALQVFGEPGSGKTSLTLRWMAVAGSNGHNTRSVPQCTPASLRTAGFSTTTVPVIFDEFNISRCPKDRYMMAREVIKSSATKQSLEFQSKNGDGSLTQNSLVCSSPIVTLATSKSTEAEIEQRTEKIYLEKDEITQGRDHEYHKNFTFVKKNEYRLRDIAGAFMREALTVDKEWLFKTQEQYYDKIDSLVPDNRGNIITQTILVGIEFAEAVIKARYKGSMTEITQIFYEMKNAYFNEMEEKAAILVKGRGELDNFFDRLSQIATEVNGRNEFILIEGIHFIKDASMLHLKVISLFGVYRTWLRNNPNLMNEFQAPALLVDAMKKSPAFAGVGLKSDLTSPDDWVSMDLGGLIERGINVQRFDRKGQTT